MNEKIFVMGNKEEIINYNLNKEYTNIPKIYIAQTSLLNSLSISQLNEEEITNARIDNQTYSQLQELLKKISDTHLDVNIQNLNFVNTITNSKFSITLRTSTYSFTHYYIEKGEIISAIKKLLLKYLKSPLPKDNFHIEIYESEEITKYILLKKDISSFILAASYGFPTSDYGFDTPNSPEFYVSESQKYQFFKNKQKYVLVREHNSIIKKEIEETENILTKEDLKEINEKTKIIEGVTIEMFFNHKGRLRINNIYIHHSNTYEFSEDGFYICKSSNNTDAISIVKINDSLEIEYPHPKYLALNTTIEISQFFSILNSLGNGSFKYDGIIFTENFFSPFIDYLGEKYNIDIIYCKNKVEKSNSVKIETPLRLSSQITNNINPFDNIIPKEVDPQLEKLKNIDLSTPTTNIKKEIEEVENVAKKLLEPKEEEELNIENNAIGLFAKRALSKQAHSKENSTISTKNHQENIEKTIEKNITSSPPGTSLDITKYNNILALDIITIPELDGDKYFINERGAYNKPTFMIINSPEEGTDPETNYILSVDHEPNKRFFYLINAAEDFFKVSKNTKGFFINIVHIRKDIIKELVKKLNELNSNIYLILRKEDINIIEELTKYIKGVYILNLSTNEELQEVKSTLLKFEKKILIESLKSQ